MGTITVPVRNRRVFIDGRLAGDGPVTQSVRCGPHRVQIGSHGEPKSVNVPCGGDTTVAP
jgi:hypothetical protein